MTFLVGRVKSIKDLILAKLDALPPRIEELKPKLDEVLQASRVTEKQARAAAANESTLLTAAIHLVETVQQAEHDRIEWQQQMLNQLNALYRQDMAHKESQKQILQKLEAAQQQIERLQQKIENLENRTV